MLNPKLNKVQQHEAPASGGESSDEPPAWLKAKAGKTAVADDSSDEEPALKNVAMAATLRQAKGPAAVSSDDEPVPKAATPKPQAKERPAPDSDDSDDEQVVRAKTKVATVASASKPQHAPPVDSNDASDGEPATPLKTKAPPKMQAKLAQAGGCKAATLKPQAKPAAAVDSDDSSVNSYLTKVLTKRMLAADPDDSDDDQAAPEAKPTVASPNAKSKTAPAADSDDSSYDEPVLRGTAKVNTPNTQSKKAKSVVDARPKEGGPKGPPHSAPAADSDDSSYEEPAPGAKTNMTPPSVQTKGTPQSSPNVRPKESTQKALPSTAPAADSDDDSYDVPAPRATVKAKAKDADRDKGEVTSDREAAHNRVPGRCVFLSRLSKKVTADDIKGMFANCGAIETVEFKLFKGKRTNGGICFVTFEESSAVASAIAMDDQKLQDKSVRVREFEGKVATSEGTVATQNVQQLPAATISSDNGNPVVNGNVSAPASKVNNVSEQGQGRGQGLAKSKGKVKGLGKGKCKGEGEQMGKGRAEVCVAPFIVAAQAFSSIHSLGSRIKDIIMARRIGKRLPEDSPDYKLVREVLQYHPKTEKTSGLTGIKVGYNKGSSRCFFLMKDDGDEDVSYCKCLDAMEQKFRNAALQESHREAQPPKKKAKTEESDQSARMVDDRLVQMKSERKGNVDEDGKCTLPTTDVDQVAELQRKLQVAELQGKLQKYTGAANAARRSKVKKKIALLLGEKNQSAEMLPGDCLAEVDRKTATKESAPTLLEVKAERKRAKAQGVADTQAEELAPLVEVKAERKKARTEAVLDVQAEPLASASLETPSKEERKKRKAQAASEVGMGYAISLA